MHLYPIMGYNAKVFTSSLIKKQVLEFCCNNDDKMPLKQGQQQEEPEKEYVKRFM